MQPKPSGREEPSHGIEPTPGVPKPGPGPELLGALLSFEPRVEPDPLAERAGIDPRRARATLTQLGTAGRVGYDTAEAGFFHRELPYDPARVTAMNPRLRNARSLAESGAVRFTAPDVAVVDSGDHTWQVRFSADRASCTCPWWTDYRGGRGPCKHLIAARLVRDTTGTAERVR